MLALSDISIDAFLPLFSKMEISVAFLVPTPTGYEKSIMDATGPVRELLKNEGIHNYEEQLQGPENKKKQQTFFVTQENFVETEASLYRPITKQGDPRIWFKNLKKYCSPCNLLALMIYEKCIYVVNLSKNEVRKSLEDGGFVYDFFKQIQYSKQNVTLELLGKIKRIHDLGFIPSITSGDPGVGDTLENALGISRNNSQTPDYKGIELKASRLSRHGVKRAKTRNTLFTKVPDDGMTYRQIVENYGKLQQPRGKTEARLQLYETFSTQKFNAYNLSLNMNDGADKLEMIHDKTRREFVSSWQMENLRTALLLKHKETFWVKAHSIDRNGIEYFQYDKVLRTKKPNVSLLSPLFDSGKITLDLAAYIDLRKKWRDHGMLFKMWADELPLLFGEPEEYDMFAYVPIM